MWREKEVRMCYTGKENTAELVPPYLKTPKNP